MPAAQPHPRGREHQAGLPALEQAGAAHRERRYDLLLGLAVGRRSTERWRRCAERPWQASQGEKRG